MLDSLELYEEISHNEFLENTEFILFLNKHDLFVEKLKTSNLSSCFPDYEGKRQSGRRGCGRGRGWGLPLSIKDRCVPQRLINLDLIRYKIELYEQVVLKYFLYVQSLASGIEY